MNKFKAGDRVKRTAARYKNCIPEGVYIVKNCIGTLLYLEGDDEEYIADNFELVEDLSDTIVSIETEQEIVTAWLYKLAYVLHNDSSVRNGIYSEGDCLLLQGDLADIRESADIYQYVENTYDQLKSQEIQKKSQKLLGQKEQSTKQLADIEKELESLK